MKKIFFVSLALVALLSACEKRDYAELPEGTVIVEENFDSNIKKLWVKDDAKDSINVNVTQGKLILQNTAIQKGYYIMSSELTIKAFNGLDTSKNFTAEADLELVSSTNATSWYGFAFGTEPIGGRNNVFGLQKDSQQYRITNNNTTIAPATSVSLNSVNTLKIEKVGKVFNYSINGVVVFSGPSQYFYSKNFGFYCGPGLTISADHLTVINN